MYIYLLIDPSLYRVNLKKGSKNMWNSILTELKPSTR